MHEIRFYSKIPQYREFSNFYVAPFKIGDDTWRTMEHYFQAMKFEDTGWDMVIRDLVSPAEAARLGKSRELPLRKDWLIVRDRVMMQGLRAKFTQNPDLCRLLVSTGNAKLIEASPTDYYWGEGSRGSGLNRLGQLLMDLREELDE